MRLVFFIWEKSLACFTRYEAQELPACMSVCNLSSDKACGPGACRPTRDSRNQCPKRCLGVVCRRSSRARARSPVPALGSKGDVLCRQCSALFRLDAAAPGVTALPTCWRRLWTASAGAGRGDEPQCPVNWQSTWGWVSTLSLVLPPSSAPSSPSQAPSFPLFRSCSLSSAPQISTTDFFPTPPDFCFNPSINTYPAPALAHKYWEP